MKSGIEGLAEDLLSPALTTGDGPGAYDRLLIAVRELRDDPTLTTPLAAAWADRSFAGPLERPLLVLAALRFLALADDGHPLAPEVLLDAEAERLPDRLVEALADPRLVDVLRVRAVRGDDPGRAMAWGVVAMALELKHHRFALVDLAAIAGPSLVIDLTPVPWKVGVNAITGLDVPSPWSRLGLQPEPLDVAADEAAARWLRACIWPSRRERLQRLDSGLAAWRRPWRGRGPAPRLERHRLGVDPALPYLEAAAAQDQVDAVVAFEAVAQPYLAPEALGAYRDELHSWLAGGRERVWITLDPAPPGPTGSGGGPMSLCVGLGAAPELGLVEIARAAYHPTGCTLVPGGVGQLRERWGTP